MATRATKTTAHENVRGKRSNNAETRDNRAMSDRSVAESRELSDDERVEMFRQQFIQSALPDLPKIPGYHVCWLTTTNPRDSIVSRVRLGYTPIRVEDVPGWEHSSIKTGEYEGCIGVNEMLAFKLPLSLYQKYMVEVHHNAPLVEEEKLRANIDHLKEQADRVGGKVLTGDGDQELGRDDRLAQFEDDEGELID